MSYFVFLLNPARVRPSHVSNVVEILLLHSNTVKALFISRSTCGLSVCLEFSGVTLGVPPGSSSKDESKDNSPARVVGSTPAFVSLSAPAETVVAANPAQEVEVCGSMEAEGLTLISTSLHMVILDLFRPYIAVNQQHGFRAYAPEPSSPRTIFAASVMQLKGKSQNFKRLILL